MDKTRSKERITKPCDNCGNPVTRLKSADAPRFYCDHKCYTSSKRHAEKTRATNVLRNPDAIETRQCMQCAAPVTKARSQFYNKTFCSKDCMYAWRRSQNKKHRNADGYLIVGVPADYPGAKRNGNYGQILEHRKVMQDMIGRPLVALENVHHINGVKDDNRPENLELWTRSQPSGQRAEDKVKWAREMLALYGDLFPE